MARQRYYDRHQTWKARENPLMYPPIPEEMLKRANAQPTRYSRWADYDFLGGVFQDIKFIYCELGHSLKHLTEIYGCSQATMLRLFKRFDLPVRPRGQLVSSQIETVLRVFREEGYTLQGVSRKLNMASKTVAEILKQNGVSYDQHYIDVYKLEPKMVEELIKDYASDATIQTLSLKYGYGVDGLEKILTHFQIPLRDFDRIVEIRARASQRFHAEQQPDRLTFAARTAIGHWKKSASSRELKWELTTQDLQDVWDAQDGKCYYTGIPMANSPTNREYRALSHRADLVSLDRKNPDGHYTKDNIVFCCSCINFAKNDWSEDEFKAFLTQIVSSINLKQAMGQTI
jgi:AraC-like DNA-binding protein